MWAGDEARNRIPSGAGRRRRQARTRADVGDRPARRRRRRDQQAAQREVGRRRERRRSHFIWINGENFRTAKRSRADSCGARSPRSCRTSAFSTKRRGSATSGRRPAATKRRSSRRSSSSPATRRASGAARDRRRSARVDPRAPRPLRVSGDSRLHRVGIHPPLLQHAGGIPPAAFANGFDADLSHGGSRSRHSPTSATSSRISGDGARLIPPRRPI